MNIGAQKYVATNQTADVDAAVPARETLRIMGYSISESEAIPGAAELRIVDGATAAGATTIAAEHLAGDESKTVWFGPRGVDARGGISIDMVSGNVDITIYYESR